MEEGERRKDNGRRRKGGKGEGEGKEKGRERIPDSSS